MFVAAEDYEDQGLDLNKRLVTRPAATFFMRAAGGSPDADVRDGDLLHAKWSARVAGGLDGASHSIFMSIAEHYAQQARYLDFGRTDSRNHGLSRFKRELGAQASARAVSEGVSE